MRQSQDIDALRAALVEARQDVVSAKAERAAADWRSLDYPQANTRCRAMEERETIARVAIVRAEAVIAAAETRARRAALIKTPTRSQLWAATRGMTEVPSGAEAKRLLEAAGIAPRTASALALREVVCEAIEARAEKRRVINNRIAAHRASQRARNEQHMSYSMAPDVPVLLPGGTPRERFDYMIREEALASSRGTLNTGPRTDITVRLGDDPGIYLSTSRCWPYGGRYKTYSAEEQDYVITVRPDWRRTVAARGLAEVADALTLAAVPVTDAPAGIEAVDALVAVRGRGYSVSTERRCYARIVGEQTWVHVRPDALSPTVAAIRGERNTEVRRIMIAAYGGIERYLTDAGARVVARDETGELLRLGTGAAAITAVRLTCPTTGRVYVERVPPTVATPREAVAWQFGLPAAAYQPVAQS